NVARERIARPDAVHVASRSRIVDRDQTTLAVDVLGEVAIQKLFRGHGQRLRSRRSLAIALVIEHEEAFVAAVVDFGNQNRSLDLPAELIEVMRVLRETLRIILERIGVPSLA